MDPSEQLVDWPFLAMLAWLALLVALGVLAWRRGTSGEGSFLLGFVLFLMIPFGVLWALGAGFLLLATIRQFNLHRFRPIVSLEPLLAGSTSLELALIGLLMLAGGYVTVGDFSWLEQLLLATLFWLTAHFLGQYKTLMAARERQLLIARLNHDLKTPVAAIRSLAEALLNRAVSAPEEQQQYLELIIDETARLHRGLENSLRIFGGEPVSDPAKVRLDLSEWLTTALARWRRVIPDLEATQGPSVIPVDGSPEMLDEALDALLENALRHGEAPISVSLTQANGQATLVVTDSGDGVALDQRGRIKEQLQAPTPHAPNGVKDKLGLWVVGHVARVHGGHASFREPNVFTLEIPLAAAPESE